MASWVLSAETFVLTFANGETQKTSNLTKGQVAGNCFVDVVTYSGVSSDTTGYAQILCDVEILSGPARVRVTRTSGVGALTVIVPVVEVDSNVARVLVGSFASADWSTEYAPIYNGNGCAAVTTLADAAVIQYSFVVAHWRADVAQEDGAENLISPGFVTGAATTNQIRLVRGAVVDGTGPIGHVYVVECTSQTNFAVITQQYYKLFDNDGEIPVANGVKQLVEGPLFNYAPTGECFMFAQASQVNGEVVAGRAPRDNTATFLLPPRNDATVGGKPIATSQYVYAAKSEQAATPDSGLIVYQLQLVIPLNYFLLDNANVQHYVQRSTCYDATFDYAPTQVLGVPADQYQSPLIPAPTDSETIAIAVDTDVAWPRAPWAFNLVSNATAAADCRAGMFALRLVDQDTVSATNSKGSAYPSIFVANWEVIYLATAPPPGNRQGTFILFRCLPIRSRIDVVVDSPEIPV